MLIHANSHIYGSGKSDAAMQRRIEKSAYGRFKKQVQEIDSTPGAWYRRRLELLAAAPSSDSEQSNANHHAPPRKSPTPSELEYADNPGSGASEQASCSKGRKRKWDGDNEVEGSEEDVSGRYPELGDPGDDEDEVQMSAEVEDGGGHSRGSGGGGSSSSSDAED